MKNQSIPSSRIVPRCEKCLSPLAAQTWKLLGPTDSLFRVFCSHLCLFEFLRAKFGDEMTRLTFFRSGR